jgi:uncharacterized protein (TIGR03435 family)
MLLAAVAGAVWLAAQAPQFEVASVKLNKSNAPMSASPTRSGDRIVMHNTRVYSMIYYAYHLHGAYSIANWDQGPVSWDWYDLDAQAPAGASDDDVRRMFQSLLADRFKLKTHREMRDIPEYELALGKGKPKLAESTEQPMKVTIEGRTITPRAGLCGTSFWQDGGHMMCQAAPIGKIAEELSALLKSPLVDRTGLTGTYNVHLRYVPEERSMDANMEPGPTLEKAVEEELGLKLQKTKGPVEVLVVDHYERPTAN